MSSNLYRNPSDFSLQVLSMFSSIYVCESMFSHMNKIKCKERNGLQDESLAACLRLSITDLELNFKDLVQQKSLKFHFKLC